MEAFGVDKLGAAVLAGGGDGAGDDIGGEVVDALCSVFKGAVDEKDGNVLILCARIGAMDTEYQTRVREKVQHNAEVEMNLEKADELLARASPFLGGATPNKADAELLMAIYVLYGLCLKPEQKMLYPGLERWFEACLAREGMRGILGATHFLGQRRAGGQIDCFADSGHVRKYSDMANELNKGVKKQLTQRQLEKASKDQKASGETIPVPAAAEVFQFANKVPADASVQEKVDAVKAALKQVGLEQDPEVLLHEPAHTMADMPPELKSKPGITCKNLFFKAKKPRKSVENDSCIWLLAVPEDAEVDLKKVSAWLGYKDAIRQAKPQVLAETMNLAPGGVTPFGLLNDSDCKVNLLLDERMLASADTMLWFHPLTNEATMGIPAETLLKFVAATARTPLVYAFPQQEAEAAGKAAKAEAAAPAAVPAQPPLGLSQDEAQARLWSRLAELGVPAPYKEKDPDLSVERPVGHSTHNLFVKDKKSKKLFLITTRQSVHVNLKALAKKVGAKELRLASSAKEAFCIDKSCITILSLYNNTQADVTCVVDSKLFDLDSLRICAGCNDPQDHSQHNVVDVTPAVVKQLLAESGHEPVFIDVDE